MPDIYDDIGRNLWDLGISLIEDDKSDIGYTTYSGRSAHVYHGENRPDHPSPFHHWQGGLVLCMVGQLCGLMGTLNEFQKAMVGDQLVIGQRQLIPPR